jgi:uncharacterized protein with PIN domain
VGLEPREAPHEGDLRLFADAMLGGLARWLRIIGYDTAYERHIEDEVLVRRCFNEGRLLLTRDRRLLEEWRVKRALLLSAEKPHEQLQEVVTRLELDWEGRLFERCTICNTLVQMVSGSDVEGQVPERILRQHSEFSHCPTCSRIYWEGSHTHRIRARLESLLWHPRVRKSDRKGGTPVSRVRIRWSGGEVLARLEETPTAQRLLEALPCTSQASTWGEEVYFEVPVEATLEPDARQVVDPGTVCFWVQGRSLAIPFGRTPASQGDECRLVTEVNVLGQLEGDPRALASIKPGDRLEVEPA